MKQSLVAQSSPDSINIHAGVRWSGPWVKGFVESNRRLYDYELVYFSAGQGRVITAGESLYCKAGTVVIIPPGLVHCTVAESELKRWCIHFDWHGDCRAHRERKLPYVYLNSPEIFNETLMAGPPGFELAFPLFRQLDSVSAGNMEEMLRRYFMLPPQTLPERLHQQGLLLQILALAISEPRLESTPKPERGNPRFFNAKSILDSRYREPGLRICDIAAELQITPNHLIKLFRRNVGMSVLDYLQTRRLENATKLLRETTLNVREIAVESGFEDPNYFTRYFHRRYGMTPTAYRRNS